MEKAAPPSDEHRSGLLQKIGLFAAVALVMSSMIGSGVFKKVAPMSDALQSPWLVLLAWLLAGLVTLCGALTNAEVAGLIAEPGGQYVYFRRMYGRAFSFFYGWAAFTVIQSASQASIAYVFAQSFNSLVELPRLSQSLESIGLLDYFYFFDNIGVKLLAVGLLALQATVNYFGVRYGSNVSSIFTTAIVICMVFIILLGLGSSEGSVAHLQSGNPAATATTLGFVGAMFTAMVGAFWAYDGWNNLSFLGGEVINPKRNIPLALGIGVAAVTGIYVLINFTYLFVLPIEDILKVYHTPNAIAGIEVVRKILGAGGALFVSLLILMTTFGSTNSSVLSSSRVYFAMARDGLFFRRVSHLHPEYRTPSVSLLVQFAWSSVLVFSGSFDQLTDMLVFAAFIFYGAGAFGVFVLRRKMPDAHRPYRAVGYPVLPALFVLFCIALVTVSLFQNPIGSLTGLGLILTGLPFYLNWRKRASKVEEVVVK